MEHLFDNGRVKFRWIGDAPEENGNIALLIPQYNEGLAGNLEKRLEYFDNLSSEFSGKIDIILIDDGSTDHSLDTMTQYKLSKKNTFYFASVYPNANKVGALYLTTKAISHKLVILSDFDTDLAGLNAVIKTSDKIIKDPEVMGCYFRLLPYEGSGNTFLFQQLEYSLARILYRFYKKDHSVPVMPGAGSCYKRDILIDIYNGHSGLRSGEDREATLLGLKYGFRTFYMENVHTLTRTPASFKSLIKQRIRWNLGYIETFQKERRYYMTQASQLTRMGITTIIDISEVILTLLIPLALTIAAFFGVNYIFILLLIAYLRCVIWCICLLNIVPTETSEFTKNIPRSVLLYPIQKFALDLIAWIGAFRVFYRKNKVSPRPFAIR